MSLCLPVAFCKCVQAMQRCGLANGNGWYITQNLGFKICSTYPALVVVPVAVSDVVRCLATACAC